MYSSQLQYPKNNELLENYAAENIKYEYLSYRVRIEERPIQTLYKKGRGTPHIILYAINIPSIIIQSKTTLNLVCDTCEGVSNFYSDL